MIFTSMFMRMTFRLMEIMILKEVDRSSFGTNHADSIKVSTSNYVDSHVGEGVHLFMPRKSYIGLIRLT